MKNLGNVAIAGIGLIGITIAVSCLIKMKNNEMKQHEDDMIKSVNGMVEGITKDLNEEILTKTKGRIDNTFKEMKAKMNEPKVNEHE